eukprot:maker-scaffold2342_size16862-snap-gene-0.3 protein:Tk12307 transcript:maker-scaffold2342_size16862-snap-gene-0.3-mRNA-1 annotation:"protein jagged-1"
MQHSASLLWLLFHGISANFLRGGFFTPLKNDEHPCVAENLKMQQSASLLWLLFHGISANFLRGGFFTPLKNDEHPCVAENLKESHRYLCDDDANVICLSGWTEPEDKELHDLRNPCPLPVCDYNGETCQHGECVRPNVCACKVGWEGHLCDTCIKLPGCVHGACNSSFECNCFGDEAGTELWEGAFCDRPACPDCDFKHGQCFEPLVCTCHDGWEGENCKTCVKLPGCVNGDCEEGKPNTCQCHDGWTGHLCDEPICTEGCHTYNGYCEEPFTCLCKTGWEGELCSECVSYWKCPVGGTCIDPNQCICSDDVKDNGFCNREIINGWRVRPCRWSAHGDCKDEVEACYGNKSWIPSSSGQSNPALCIYNPEDGAEIMGADA